MWMSEVQRKCGQDRVFFFKMEEIVVGLYTGRTDLVEGEELMIKGRGEQCWRSPAMGGSVWDLGHTWRDLRSWSAGRVCVIIGVNGCRCCCWMDVMVGVCAQVLSVRREVGSSAKRWGRGGAVWGFRK